MLILKVIKVINLWLLPAFRGVGSYSTAVAIQEKIKRGPINAYTDGCPSWASIHVASTDYQYVESER